MKKQTKKQQSGRSMIEMVGVLAVMGLITAAAFILINSALASQRLSRIDDDVSGIVNGVRLLYNSQPDFTGIDGVGSTYDQGKATMVLLGFGGDTDKTRYQNPYGGYYILAKTASTDRGFTVKITNLGEKTCNVLKNRSWPAGGVLYDKNGYKCDGATKDNYVMIRYGKADSSMNP